MSTQEVGYGKVYVRCVISGLRDKAKITCINYEKRRKYFPDLGGNYND